MNGTPQYTINDCVKQLNYTMDAQRGTTIVTEEWIGPTDTIEDLALTWYAGKKFDSDGRIPDTKLSGYIQSSVASKMEAERSKWTVSTSSKGRMSISGGGGGEDTEAVWTFSTSEYEESTLRFLDKVQTNMFIKWEASDDKHLLRFTDNNKVYYLSSYATADGEKYPDAENITDKNLYNVALLKLLGVTSVKNYYLTVTRTQPGIDNVNDIEPVTDMGTVDDTPASKFNYTDIDWLYTGHNVQQINKENYTVTDTWTGVNKDWGGWLTVLYGENHMEPAKPAFIVNQ